MTKRVIITASFLVVTVLTLYFLITRVIKLVFSLFRVTVKHNNTCSVLLGNAKINPLGSTRL